MPVALRSKFDAGDHFLHLGLPAQILEASGACSVYAARPLACCKHASFLEDDPACQTDVMNTTDAPSVPFAGLDEALFAVSERGEVVLADIRDFFPLVHP